jgi:hypothetical protein
LGDGRREVVVGHGVATVGAVGSRLWTDG